MHTQNPIASTLSGSKQYSLNYCVHFVVVKITAKSPIKHSTTFHIGRDLVVVSSKRMQTVLFKVPTAIVPPTLCPL